MKRETPPAGGTLFAILSALLLANAGFLVAAWLAKRPDFYAAFVSFAFGETVIGFFLLRSLRDARQEFVARTVAALSMGLSILDFLIGIGLFAAYIVQVSEASRQGGSAAQFSWTRIPYIQYWTYYAAGWRALTGITGAIRYIASRLAPAAPRGNESQP